MENRGYLEYETYLFDLGGVVIDIDPQATIDAFAVLGLPDLHKQINRGHHLGLFEQFEKGEINNEVFIQNILEELPKTCSQQKVIEAWNKMLVNFPIKRIQILERLKEDKSLYLLSNTNGIHREKFIKMASGYESIEYLFNDVFYSYKLKCSKPDTKPFEKVIEMTGLNPDRTLFLDDAQANLDTAQKLGFHTVLVTKEYPMEKIFKGLPDF